jgi:hypothetical protein
MSNKDKLKSQESILLG